MFPLNLRDLAERRLYRALINIAWFKAAMRVHALASTAAAWNEADPAAGRRHARRNYSGDRRGIKNLMMDGNGIPKSKKNVDVYQTPCRKACAMTEIKDAVSGNQ